jgi:hypothetical protein
MKTIVPIKRSRKLLKLWKKLEPVLTVLDFTAQEFACQACSAYLRGKDSSTSNADLLGSDVTDASRCILVTGRFLLLRRPSWQLAVVSDYEQYVLDLAVLKQRIRIWIRQIECPGSRYVHSDHLSPTSRIIRSTSANDVLDGDFRSCGRFRIPGRISSREHQRRCGLNWQV